jgi:LysM repeat protein
MIRTPIMKIFSVGLLVFYLLFNAPHIDVERWQIHARLINTVSGANAVDIKAGYADSGGTEYITVMAGYVASGANSITGAEVGQVTVEPTAQFTPEVPVFIPIITATPSLDGSIIHTVQPGESVIMIAAAYNMSALELLTLNGLNMSSVLYPGDTLTIIKGSGPVPTATAIPPTRAPTSTSIIKVNEDGVYVTPGPIKVRIASDVELSDRPDSPPDSTETLITQSNLLIALGVAVLSGLLIFILSLRNR